MHLVCVVKGHRYPWISPGCENLLVYVMHRSQLRKTTASVSNYVELYRAVCRSQIQAD